jgi:bifunctional polynucleotide phosphatase/kinase
MSKRNYQSIDPKWLDKSTPEQIMKKADSDDEDIDLIALFQAQQQRKREKKVALTSSTTKIKKVASFGVGRKEDTNALRQKEHTSKSSSSPQKTMSTSQKELQEPVKKKTKVDASNVQQSSLFNFFSTASTKKTKTTKTSKDKESQSSNVAAKTVSVGTELKKQKESLPTSATDEIPDPIIPKEIPQQRNVAWRSIQDNLVIIRKPINEKARKKVAAFDIDGTLMIWRTASSWPSSLSHYELWASTVPGKLRALYDDGYKLVLISNQGAIQKAHDGKNAKRVKNLIDWISHVIDRPLYAVLSTKTLKKDPYSFHKPTEKMWSIAIDVLNRQRSFNVKESFFVGDSADINDPQGGVDFRFAQNVAQKYGNGTDLTFHTPEEYFGPSDSERRQRSKSLEKSAIPPPKEALAARSALLGGYIRGPILLILCGVQGSGKSTFCNKLVEGKKDYWVHLSQDTINNGKPGKREKVEEEAKAALERGQSTVIDRMHLDEEQRSELYNQEQLSVLQSASAGCSLHPFLNVSFT